MQGKVVLVTGAASGIGAATARRLAGLGATVVVTDITTEKGELLAHELGTPHLFRELDVSSEHAWARVLEDVAGTLNGIDVVFLNAGATTRPQSHDGLDDPVSWLTQSHYRRVLGINLDGVVLGALAAIPYLEARGGGALVATASGAAIRPYAPDPFYTLAKHAVVGFVRALAPSLAERNIVLNAICPGGVDTGMVAEDLKIRTADAVLSKLSGRPFQSPEDFSQAIVEILRSGRTGEIWTGYAGEPARPYDYPADAAVITG